MRLQDRVAVVTGAGRGIGAATAERFAAEGAAVAVVDLDAEAAARVAQTIAEQDRVAHPFTCDVADAGAVEALLRDVEETLGPVDILVNNAGIVRDAKLDRMTESDFDAVVRVNLKGTFCCTQAFSRGMVERGRGRIINVSSVVGLYGNFGQTNYVATKAGVIGMTKVWAKELGRKGVCVNAVAPGFIGTEMVAGMPEKVVDKMKSRIPSGRLGTPAEVASVYVFLASDDASYVNGAVISVDGGMIP